MLRLLCYEIYVDKVFELMIEFLDEFINVLKIKIFLFIFVNYVLIISIF